MIDVIIKFRDRNRSDLKLKAREVFPNPHSFGVELETKEGVHIMKHYPIDLIEEVQTIAREGE